MGRKRKEPNFSQLTWVEDHVAGASLAYKDYDYTEVVDPIQLNPCWQHFKTIDSARGLRCKIWISPANGNVLVSFRGTSSIAEAKIDGTLGKTPFKSGKEYVVGEVYKGFGDAWTDIAPVLEDNIRYLRDTQYINQGSVLQFSGHSLGGAMADLSTTFFADKYSDIQVISTTLGAPMVGDQNYADHARAQPNVERTRIKTNLDPVSNVKIPGLQHTEQVNVITTSTPNKRFKFSLTEAAKMAANHVSPGLGMLLGAADTGLQNHSLDSYQAYLNDTMADSSIQSIDNPDVQQRREDDAWQELQESPVPVSVTDCACDCHIFDASQAQGDPPPPSTGTTQDIGTPAVQPSITSAPPLPVSTNATQEQVSMTPQQQQLFNYQQQQQQLTSLLPQDMSTALTQALQAQEEKEKDDLQKLQDQYAQLTNQNTGNVDPVAFDKQRIQNQMDDVNYLQNRIQMELQYPQYVPNDADGGTGSRDMAVAFKNKMNGLYSEIMQAATANRARTLDPKTAQTDSTVDYNKAMTDDQFNQIDKAAKDGELNPDDQPSGYIFDIKSLGDDLNSDTVKQQLQTWLNYPDMSPQTLFEDLKDQFSQDYTTQRLSSLRNQEEKDNQTWEDTLKSEIEEKSKNMTQFDQQRSKFINTLAQNGDFQQMFEDGKVDLNSVVQMYKGENSEQEIMKNILGYDASAKGDEQSRYREALRELNQKGLMGNEYTEAFNEIMDVHNVLKNNQWMQANDVQSLFDTYKNNPDQIERRLEQMRDSHWNRPTPAGLSSTNPYAITVDLSKKADNLVNDSSKIQQGNFQDDYLATQQKLWKDYQDPNKMKDYFSQWNQGNQDQTSLVNTIVGSILNPLTAPGNVDHYIQDKKAGWYDKDGNFLGHNAAPDFAAYVQAHPDAGISYRGADYNPYLDDLSSVGNLVQSYAMETRFGINANSSDVQSMISGAMGNNPNGGDANHDGIPDNWESTAVDTQGPEQQFNSLMENLGGLAEQVGQYKFFNRGSRTNYVAEDGIGGETSRTYPRSMYFRRPIK